MCNRVLSDAHIPASVLVVLHPLAIAFHIVANLLVLAWRQSITQRGPSLAIRRIRSGSRLMWWS